MSLYQPTQIDDVIHGRNRFLVLTALSNESSMEFVELRDRLGLQDGSLHLALKKLEEVRFVELAKGRSDAGRSRTTVKITSKGRKAFYAYLDELKELMATIPHEDRPPTEE